MRKTVPYPADRLAHGIAYGGYVSPRDQDYNKGIAKPRSRSHEKRRKTDEIEHKQPSSPPDSAPSFAGKPWDSDAASSTKQDALDAMEEQYTRDRNLTIQNYEAKLAAQKAESERRLKEMEDQVRAFANQKQQEVIGAHQQSEGTRIQASQEIKNLSDQLAQMRIDMDREQKEKHDQSLA